MGALEANKALSVVQPISGRSPGCRLPSRPCGRSGWPTRFSGWPSSGNENSWPRIRSPAWSQAHASFGDLPIVPERAWDREDRLAAAPSALHRQMNGSTCLDLGPALGEIQGAAHNPIQQHNRVPSHFCNAEGSQGSGPAGDGASDGLRPLSGGQHRGVGGPGRATIRASVPPFGVWGLLSSGDVFVRGPSGRRSKARTLPRLGGRGLRRVAGSAAPAGDSFAGEAVAASVGTDSGADRQRVRVVAALSQLRTSGTVVVRLYRHPTWSPCSSGARCR
jgi:hypothetical protein